MQVSATISGAHRLIDYAEDQQNWRSCGLKLMLRRFRTTTTQKHTSFSLTRVVFIDVLFQFASLKNFVLTTFASLHVKNFFMEHVFSSFACFKTFVSRPLLSSFTSNVCIAKKVCFSIIFSSLTSKTVFRWHVQLYLLRSLFMWKETGGWGWTHNELHGMHTFTPCWRNLVIF